PEAQGSVFWHPKGWTIYQVIRHYMQDIWKQNGYQEINTPQLVDYTLWEKSGHAQKFKDEMFSVESDNRMYAIKPMNCPCHVQVFNHGLKSYRDLPLRLAEFGACHRYEPSGSMHGLMRVRAFTQDDAHIFCTPSQLEGEVIGVLELAQYMLSSFGFREYEMELAIRGKGEKDKYIGSDKNWEAAETALKRALEYKHLPFVVGEGEAKFYGPSIDIRIKDALGRGWQGPTIQVDFNLPERFDVNYVGPDGKEHKVVMIHRTVLGAMERFLGCLIEHYAGAFPLWIAPTQVKVLTIKETHADYANSVKASLQEKGLRVQCDLRNTTIGYKIREGRMEKVPYLLIIGDKEVEQGSVSLRSREKGDEGSLSTDALLVRLEREIKEKL
ncbi:MAG TPA: threonine--tRNA ligase, partial [Candidatus Hypogeohydataceae bacterium YC40]